MKVVVVSEFIDKESGERMVKGAELDLNPFRAGELFAKGRVKPLEEKAPEKKQKPVEPESEKKEVEHPHTKKHERK